MVFFNYDFNRWVFEGIFWVILCWKIIDILFEKVYISFDIDGLLLEFCLYIGIFVFGGFMFD